MDNFTKAELKELMYGLWCRAKIDGKIINKILYDKLKSMIDNYKEPCNHSHTECIGGWCFKCTECDKIFGDVTQ